MELKLGVKTVTCNKIVYLYEMNNVRKNLLLFLFDNNPQQVLSEDVERNAFAFALTFGKLNFLAGKPQVEQYPNNESIFLKNFERKTSKTCNVQPSSIKGHNFCNQPAKVQSNFEGYIHHPWLFIPLDSLYLCLAGKNLLLTHFHTQ